MTIQTLTNILTEHLRCCVEVRYRLPHQTTLNTFTGYLLGIDVPILLNADSHEQRPLTLAVPVHVDYGYVYHVTPLDFSITRCTPATVLTDAQLDALITARRGSNE